MTTLGAGGFDKFVWKTDKSGNILWEGNINGQAGYDELFSIMETKDGGYVVAGSASGLVSYRERIYMAKLDSAGNILWERFYRDVPGSGFDEETSYCVEKTSDGGFILSGKGYDQDMESGSAILLKTDGNGNITWIRFYVEDTYGCASARCVKQTGDKGYVFAGGLKQDPNADWDVYLVKTDASGKPVWKKKFGGSKNDFAYSIDRTKDGGYILAGYTESSGVGKADAFVIKTLSAGNCK